MLEGYTVGITADRRWDEQAALFKRRGARVIHGPAIRTLPLGADQPLRSVTEALVADPPVAVVANTGLGMRSWFGAAESWGLGEALAARLRGARLYARGPKASGALHSAGLEVVARARSERLREVVDLVVADLARAGRTGRVAVQVDGSGGSPELSRLAALGLEVVAVPVYLWRIPDDVRPAVKLAEHVIAGRVHAVTFTAGPAIRNWMAIASEQGLDRDLRSALTSGQVVVGCVGPVCAEAASDEGLASPHVVQPEASRLGPLVRAVSARLEARTMVVGLSDTEMVLRGTAAWFGDRAVSLSETEARLLTTLAERPNAVFTKDSLLQAVWGSTEPGPHTVEVAVARLRRRLGVHGDAVEAVHRRGYTLRV